MWTSNWDNNSIRDTRPGLDAVTMPSDSAHLHKIPKSRRGTDLYDQRALTPIGLPGRRPVPCAERLSALPGVSIILIGKSRLSLPVSHSVNIRMSP